MSELKHSDTYLGADYSDGLKHWKYIKRYRGRRGKWVYVYANDKVHRLIQADKRLADMNNESAEEYASDAYRLRQIADEHKKNGRKSDGSLERAARGQAKRAGIHEEARDWYNNDAYEKMYNNSISKVSKDLVNVGKSFIDDLIKNAKKAGKILF